jgi:anthranilate/para-aminobenzoate synthase component I
LGRHLEPAAVATRFPAGERPSSWPLIELHQLQQIDDGDASSCSSAVGPLQSIPGSAAYQRGVAGVLEFIRAGDCYQANLAHELTAPFEGSPRHLFARLVEHSVPPHAMYVEAAPVATQPFRAMLSLSPELFLDYDARTRRVITRPMKGTRPCVPGAYEELEASAKDRAELAMIVDLMRNDIGRVCDFGSVHVDVPRRIERHPNAAGGVWQAIAQVSGTLRDGLDAADLIAATFPAGSVTGAPKIRAMQIIDELEPTRRGIYCGSAIHIREDGSVKLSVAIRTALIESDQACGDSPATDHMRGSLRYSVGAGIVADSDPASEWQETLVKAGVISGSLQHMKVSSP